MHHHKMTMVERLIDGYEKAKKPIAFIVMFIAVLLGTLPSDLLAPLVDDITHTYTVVVLSLAMILMAILFEIYEKVVKEKKYRA